jgi:hypothetical protein
LKKLPVAARLKPTPPGRTLPVEPAAARAKTADSASSRNIIPLVLCLELFQLISTFVAVQRQMPQSAKPQRLAYNVATLDGKASIELKHLLLKEHARLHRAEHDQNLVKMTNRWADKVLHAAEKACEISEMTAHQAVLWDSKGKWHLEQPRGKPRVEPQSPHRSEDASPLASPMKWRGKGLSSVIESPHSPLASRRGTGLSSVIESPHIPLASPMKRRGTGLSSVIESPYDPAPAYGRQRMISAEPIDLGSGNDQRLGNMRGMLELMARKKMQTLELLEAATTTASTLDNMKAQISDLLHAHDTLAGGAQVKRGKLAADKRRLLHCEQRERDTLNTMSCCRSISQVRAIPEGWKWSNNRATCDACRAVLHTLQIQHSATEILARRVAGEEGQLAQTKQALANVGTAVKHVLDEAIYRPITFKTQNAVEEADYGIVFSVAAMDHPVVVTGIYCARHPWSQSSLQNMVVLVSPCRTQELGWKMAHDLTSWSLAGHSGDMPESYTSLLPCVSVLDSVPSYGPVPLKHPFVVEAGTHRSIAIHTDDRHGILNRYERSMSVVGEPSDLAPSLEVKVGLVLGPDLKTRPMKATKTACFVGQLVYRRVPRQ